MSENKRSFWSSVPGLVTGLAGLLTGIVGLVTVLIQLNVIGGDSSSDTPAASVAPTTVAGQAPAGGATPTTATVGRLTAEPSTLKLQPTEKEKAVTIRNSGTAMLTVEKPEYTGADKAAFTAVSDCTTLRPGASCTVRVQLTPSGPLKTYRASLVLGAKELPGVTEVPVEASTIL